MNKVKTMWNVIVTKVKQLNFLTWIISSLLLSLSNVWIVFLLSLFLEEEKKTIFLASQYQSLPFIVFSITFLSDNFVKFNTQIKNNSNKHAASIRGLVDAIVIFYLLLLICIWICHIFSIFRISVCCQWFILIISVLISIIPWCLQDNEWEPTVEKLVEVEESKVSSLVDNTVSDDGTGIKI